MACLALSSVPAQADEWKPVAPKADLDYLVDSVHRIGTHVYLIDRGTMFAPRGSLRYEASLEFDCSDHALRMAWADITGPGQPAVRAYGNTNGHYAASRFVSAAASAFGEPILEWACHLPDRPERLVNVARTSDGKLIQIDSRSIARSGPITSFWTRYDYPQLRFDPPYDAPYDSKREKVVVNCETNRFRISVGYDFTPAGAVTDDTIARDDVETPIDSTDDYEAAIKAIACGPSVDPETFMGIGGDTQRAKTPLFADLDIDSVPAPNSVIAAAERFNAGLPAPSSFKSARLVETMKGSKTGTSKTVIVIRPSASGITRVREIYSPDFFVDRDMVGFVQLKSKMNMSRSENRRVYVTQALTVKANDWKQGGEISFVTEGVNVPGADKPMTFGLDCQVKDAVKASTIADGLDGQAWPLDCTRLNGDTAKAYYIEALSYFLDAHEQSKSFGVTDTTIDSVTIER